MNLTIKKSKLEKYFTLKNNRGYFVFENFFEDPEAPDFLITISIRNSGKTTGALCLALKNWYQNQKRFVWVRRREVEINQIKADIGKFNSFKWKGKTKYIFRSGYMLYDDEKNLIGWLVALSTFQNIKGRDFADASLLIFDEFMSEDNCYLKDEFEMFYNLVTTVQRMRTPFKVLLLGNNINPFNLYIQKFGFEINSKVERYEKLVNKKYKIWLINDRNLAPILKEEQHTVAYQLAQLDKKAKDYLLLGEYRNQNFWMCSTFAYIEATPEYNFWLWRYPFHSRRLGSALYICEGINHECEKTYGLTQLDCHEQSLNVFDFRPLAELWSRAFLKKQIWFDNENIYNLVLQWLRPFKPKGVI